MADQQNSTPQDAQSGVVDYLRQLLPGGTGERRRVFAALLTAVTKKAAAQ